MSFDLIETSEFMGSPVELFEFSRGDEYWRYTSADENKTVGQSYEAIQITRSKINNSQDTSKSPVTITCPRTSEISELYLAGKVGNIIDVAIKQYHESDTVQQVITIWIGRISNVKFDDDKCSIKCESILSSLNRTTVPVTYQKTCPHILYGDACKADKSLGSVDGTVSSVTKHTITAPEFSSQPDGYFVGGYVEAELANYSEYMNVVEHVGNTITLSTDVRNIIAGSTVTAFSGCKHNTSDCQNKFNNIENYGGFPWIPRKNPMAGESVF